MEKQSQTPIIKPKQEILSFNEVKYQVGGFLGSGLTSDVYKAVSVIDKACPSKIAIKDIKLSFNEEFNSEVLCLDHLDHPNIIKMVGCKFPTFNDNRQLLALEYCKYEFYDLVIQTNGFPENIGRYFFNQEIIPAVTYMHIQDICHRDLKLDNLLIGEDLKIRIADFTFGARMTDQKTQQPKLFTRQCGTVLYMAPEIQRGRPYKGDLADIYSLGVILFMLVMGQNPFPNINFYEMLWKKTQIFWNQFYKKPSKEFKNLVERMLCYNPENRITMEDIRQHTWSQKQIPTAEFIKGCFNQKSNNH